MKIRTTDADALSICAGHARRQADLERREEKLMKDTIAITIAATSLLAVAPLSAGPGQGKGSGSEKQVQQPDQARSQAHHSETHHERSQAIDHARHERSYMLSDHDIYGNELMSAADCDQYREQLRVQTSETERQQVDAPTVLGCELVGHQRENGDRRGRGGR
jgi:hypothetical protein